MRRHNFYRDYRINYSEPWKNPVAILCNGAHLWDQAAAEKLAAEDPFAVIMWPRRRAEQAAEAEEEFLRRQPVIKLPTITRQYYVPGKAGEFGEYRADVTEYSDGRFEARVYLTNDFVLVSGQVDASASMTEVINREIPAYYAGMAAHYEE